MSGSSLERRLSSSKAESTFEMINASDGSAFHRCEFFAAYRINSIRSVTLMIDDADGISLLDMLVFFAENWLLLILMPALVAVGTYMWVGTLPPTYKATISITVPEMDVEGAPPIDTRSFYRAVLAPREGIKAAISSNGATITAEHWDAERASEMAIAVHSDAVAALTLAFEQHVDVAEAIIAKLDPVLNQIRGDIGDDPTQVLALVQILDALGPLQSRVLKSALGIETLQTVLLQRLI
jgi:hypothetical protein